MKNYLIYCFASIFFVSLNANATESFTGKVVALAPSYMPSYISFQLDSGSSTCPANQWLKWMKSDLDNMKIVYATLLAAISSGKLIRIYVNEKCEGEYLHILQ
ncbi:hypothetical protein BFR75_02520 [Acinetobacter pittii]|uniref:hypothetical protein n=1 Tax=Acinetobacter pittii TaxID=48296 RepID=UPI000838A8B0|nr:hypothetical protein [Acinetobacter pittii]OCY34594.1 hypothetical protein BFR75_02520 [Acinetobacter pittii]